MTQRARLVAGGDAVRGVAILGAGGVVGRVIAVVAFPVVARFVGPVELGTYALAAACVLVLEPVVGLGVADFIVSAPDLDEAHVTSAFWANLGAAAVAVAAIWAVAPWLESSFEAPGLAWLVRALSAGLVLHALMVVPSAWLLRERRFGSLAARTVLSAPVAGVVGIGLAVAGAGKWALVAQTLAADAVVTVALLRAASFRPALVVSRVHWGAVWRSSRSVLGIGLLNVSGQRAVVALVGSLVGTAATGWFAVGQRVQQLMTQMLVKPLESVSLATFAHWQEDRAKAGVAFVRATTLASWALWPAFAGLALVAPVAVPLVLGDRWAGAAGVVQAFAAAGIPLVPSYLASSALRAFGRPSAVLGVRALELGLFAGTVLALHRQGVAVAALGFVGALTVGACLQAWLLSRVIQLHLGPYAARLGRVLFVLGALALAVWGIELGTRGWPALARVAAMCAGGATGYMAASAVLAREIAGDALSLVRRALLKKTGRRGASAPE